ncbi:MAG: hypothetical protein HYU43_00840 [Armatimonadetes bacterium]|nr:hypothetical protein [Planctomycetota bacterium]MBI2200473.1 hypothetical protein [Armatimonadota bacterium]
MRRQIIVGITFLAGLYFFLEFILPPVIPPGAPEGEGFRFGRYDEEISVGFTAVGAMAIALGAISILRLHGGQILRKRRGWGVSLVLVSSLLVSTGIFLAMWFERAQASGAARPLEELAAAQEIILSSAKTPPIPPPMREMPLERIPESLRRPATIEERGAAQRKLVEALRRLHGTSGREALDAEVLKPLAESESAAESGLAALDGRDEARAEMDLTRALQAMRKAAEARRRVAGQAMEHSLTNRVYTLLNDGLYNALGSAMFSLLAFYIATAAYRAFRVKSKEALLLMVAALLVMLGQIPLGVYLLDALLGPAGSALGADHLSITQVRLWILRVVNTAAFRGIALGSAIAGLSMAWRVWWSLESSAWMEPSGPAEKDQETERPPGRRT